MVNRWAILIDIAVLALSGGQAFCAESIASYACTQEVISPNIIIKDSRITVQHILHGDVVYGKTVLDGDGGHFEYTEGGDKQPPPGRYRHQALAQLRCSSIHPDSSFKSIIRYK
jgi:hypothetical protein